MSLISLNRTFYGIETLNTCGGGGFCRRVLIVPFMELKPAGVQLVGLQPASLNRTFYGIETMEIGERQRSPHRVLIVPFMELKLK